MTTRPESSTSEPDSACPCCGNPAAFASTPCNLCSEQMKRGILLIEVEDWGGGPPGEPRRTGRAACIAESGLRRCVPSEALVEHTLRQGYAYVSQAAWKSFGLPKPGAGEVN